MIHQAVLLQPKTNHEPRCAKCGYIAIGLPSSICPECGSDLRLVGYRTDAEPHGPMWITLAVAAIVTLIAFQYGGRSMGLHVCMALVCLPIPILISLRITGAIRARWWVLPLLLIATACSFPHIIAWVMENFRVGRGFMRNVVYFAGRSQWQFSPAIKNRWMELSPLLAFAWVAAAVFAKNVGELRIQFHWARKLWAIALPLLLMFTLANAAVLGIMSLIGIERGKFVSENISPDRQNKLVVYRYEDFMEGASYIAFLQPNEPFSLTCRRMLSQSEIEGDRKHRIEFAWTPDSTMVVSWRDGVAMGVETLTGKFPPPLEQVAYRLTPPGAGQTSLGARYRQLTQSTDRRGNKPTGAGFTIDAVERGDLQAVQELLEAGAPIDDRYYTETPLHRAVSKGNVAIARYLLDRGADPNVACWSWGSRPLCLACSRADLAMATLLIERGVEVNVVVKDSGNTPLMYAAQFGPPQLVKLLLDHGADAGMRNPKGQTAADFAKRRNPNAGDTTAALTVP